ncbi:MAG: enoyl-CoA hydratase [Desulfococcus sp. 4484_241]|nr:MAG: enoyl-CoA hydratase [Desulfococcus sp. 4484_241]
MTEKELAIEVRGNTAWLTINRPDKRNSISPEVVELFGEALDSVAKDDTVRVAVITGAGDRAFCSGADLSGGDMAGRKATVLRYAQLLKRIYTFPKPTVARVNGHCLAGGTGFMLACDIVVAKKSAMFGTPEVNVGLFPMMIGALIFRNVPRKKAMEMVLLGERLTAEQALDMGLVTRVVDDEQLDREVDDLLNKLAEKSPAAMRIGKEAFCAAEEMRFGDAVDFLALKLLDVADTEDAREGITAFLEKRRPLFTGK